MTEKPDYQGMTPNERLFVAGTLNAFDEAIRRGQRERAIRLLRDVELEGAERTVDRALADPNPVRARQGLSARVCKVNNRLPRRGTKKRPGD